MDEDEKVNSALNLPHETHVMIRILQYWSETEQNTQKSRICRKMFSSSKKYKYFHKIYV
jgi:hypothetical protein